MSNATTTFGSWLKQRRRFLGFTQAQLAKMVPCGVSTLSGFERGTAQPSRAMAVRLACELGITGEAQSQFVRLACTSSFTNSHSAHRSRHSAIPVPQLTLLGRTKEIGALRTLIIQQRVQLLTVFGPPGIGKTSLTRQVIYNLQEDFRDGVYWIELAPMQSLAMVVPAIAAALGIPSGGETTTLESVKLFLENRHVLLVLDNIEHLIAVRDNISAIVGAAPNITIVTTSRSLLHLPEETVFHIPPLALPSKRQDDVDVLVQFSSVQLFIERAQAVNSKLDLSPVNIRAIAHICVRLEGLPLAIELAARRSQLFPPRALLARLSQQIPLLKAKVRDVPERQQTLRAAIDWSYTLLTPQEQHLLSRMSVFFGGCSLAAAVGVCSDNLIPADAIEIHLGSLGNQSMVKISHDAAGNARYSLLEMVREYALEQLNNANEAERLYQRHYEYFLTLAEAGEHGLYSAAQGQWRTLLQIETDNLRSALAWCLKKIERAEAGLRLAAVLRPFWDYAGLHFEGYEWIERLLNEDRAANASVKIKAMNTAGFLMAWQSDNTQARQMLQTSLALSEKTGDLWGRGHALLFLGTSTDGIDPTETIRIAEEVLELFTSLNDVRGLAMAKWRLGFELGLHFGSLPEAFARSHTLLEESEQLLRTLGDRWTLVYPTGGFAVSAHARGHLAESYSYWEQALVYAREGGSPWLIDVTLANLALLAGHMNDLERKKVHCQEMYEQSYHLVATRRAYAILLLACAERDLFNFPRAVELMRETIIFAHRHNMFIPVIYALYELVWTVLSLSEPLSDNDNNLPTLAHTIFGTTLCSSTARNDLLIFASTVLGALVPLNYDARIRHDQMECDWFLYADVAQRLQDPSTFHQSVAYGFTMNTEQLVTYVLQV